MAVEAFFLAGMLTQQPKQRFSAAWFWAVSMCLLGLAALLGGIDHGFIEPREISRVWIRKLTWLTIGAITFCVLQTIAHQFFTGKHRTIISRLAWLQLAVYIVAMNAFESFTIAVLNYAPVMLWFLIMNLGYSKVTRGDWRLVVGSCLLFAASGAQVLQIDTFYPLDSSSLYHLISMPALLFFFYGGQSLNIQTHEPPISEH